MELVRKGKRVYGAFVTGSFGTAYVAFRKPGDFFIDNKPGEGKSISEGIVDGTAACAINEEHLQLARRRGCKYIGVWVRVQKWLLIAPLDSYFDRDKFYRRNYAGRGGGSDQRYLACKYFVRKAREDFARLLS